MAFKNPFLNERTKPETFLVKDYKSLFNRYKRGAESRDLLFNLSEEKFLETITSVCSFCGVEPFQKHGKILYMGVDRTVNTEGYVDSNVSPCCKTCNFAKGSMEFWEFDEWLERVSDFYPRKMKAYKENSMLFLEGKSMYEKAKKLMEEQ